MRVVTRPAAAVDLRVGHGHWLTPDLIAWPREAVPPGADPDRLGWWLCWSRDGGLDPTLPEPVPWPSVPLTFLPEGLPADLAARFPHLAGALALRVPDDVPVADALRGQVGVVVRLPSGRLAGGSSLQTAAVLDALHPDARHARLGATWDGPLLSVRVWAPTAHRVEVLLWPAGTPLSDPATRCPMLREPDGCWVATGDRTWLGGRYLYAVTVFVPSFGRVVTNLVTDPYSHALTLNSTHTVVVDLDDPELAPPQWRDTPAPPLASPVDQVSYELHVRDFSMADPRVPDAVKGTYTAFTVDSLGARHLRRLAQAGLTTVQLLPIYDNCTAEEDRDRQARLDPVALRRFPPDSPEQQRILATSAGRDAYNWGYDPWHYQAPEGSYSTPTAAGGAGRVREVRAMIGALHGLGLRVVLDQVFNHTSEEGQGVRSTLGRIVPGYYHRRDALGALETSSCCPNVATEHAMAEKLMVDSVVHWARHYRVDGFRFDLMGHHSRANLLAVRAALDALTLADDGVDGPALTLHGEGWSFGEVAHNARFVQAAQGQLGGTHIATFSDRLRDAVRGGRPFGADVREQGFGTGLATAPNGHPGEPPADEQQAELAHATDLVQLGLAGTLRAVAFRSNRSGACVRGDELDYQGQPAGYTDHPDEAVNYVDAHDNETLFDALTLKLPRDTPMTERVRVNTLCLALATWGQSPVMWHAGSDFLRSKSLDRNSFDSGDWFNWLDFAMRDNGFGAGLPPAADNASRWPILAPLLADPTLKPEPAHLRRAHACALDVLRVRASSRLFRLGDPDQVLAKVRFPVSGSWAAQPGVAVLHLDDTAGEPVDPRWAGIVVAFNGAPWPVRQHVPQLPTHAWVLHPVLAEGADPVTREARCDDDVFAVPGRTAAVFVSPR